MKVAIIGITGDELDEGMKNFGKQLYRNLKNLPLNAELFDIKHVVSPEGIAGINRYDPDVIHLIPGPTLKGLLLVKAVGRLVGAKTVVSATHPHLWTTNPSVLKLLKPDLILVQSSNSERIFAEADYHTDWLPSGVDTDKFHPVAAARKEELRGALGLPEKERVFLHVGHLKKERNVLELDQLAQYGTIVIIGSPSTDQEQHIVDKLQGKGHQVHSEFIENIQHYYQTADFYVFPTEKAEHSIEIPLSVLEAMACNIPVISKRFGGLPDLFDEGTGIQFVESLGDITDGDLTKETSIENRDRVIEYSWPAVAEAAFHHYEGLQP